MRQEFEEIKANAEAAIDNVNTPSELEKFRIQYLGRRGALSLVLRALKDLPDAERR